MYIYLDEQIQQKKITRYKIAKDLDVPYSTIFNITNGNTTSISFAMLEKLCIELNCTPNDILFFGERKPNGCSIG